MPRTKKFKEPTIKQVLALQKETGEGLRKCFFWLKQVKNKKE